MKITKRPGCGANLDHGEVCDCVKKERRMTMKAQTLADLLDAFPEAHVMSEGSDVEVAFSVDENGEAVFDVIKKKDRLNEQDGQSQV